jgi:hypothetical protein
VIKNAEDPAFMRGVVGIFQWQRGLGSNVRWFNTKWVNPGAPDV